VRGSVRDGRTFKGFPLHFPHASASRIAAALGLAAPCRDILDTPTEVCVAAAPVARHGQRLAAYVAATHKGYSCECRCECVVVV